MTEHLRTPPVITIANGVHLPAVGFGTYLISDDEASGAVAAALEAGYRHVDTAEVYENEAGVGRAINAALSAGLRRDDLFVTTKLFPGNPASVELDDLRSYGVALLVAIPGILNVLVRQVLEEDRQTKWVARVRHARPRPPAWRKAFARVC
jgi:aryl-alcohol dehydrogenase-like predicted oxidoreductase